VIDLFKEEYPASFTACTTSSIWFAHYAWRKGLECTGTILQPQVKEGICHEFEDSPHAIYEIMEEFAGKRCDFANLADLEEEGILTQKSWDAYWSARDSNGIYWVYYETSKWYPISDKTLSYFDNKGMVIESFSDFAMAVVPRLTPSGLLYAYETYPYLRDYIYPACDGTSASYKFTLDHPALRSDEPFEMMGIVDGVVSFDRIDFLDYFYNTFAPAKAKEKALCELDMDELEDRPDVEVNIPKASEMLDHIFFSSQLELKKNREWSALSWLLDRDKSYFQNGEKASLLAKWCDDKRDNLDGYYLFALVSMGVPFPDSFFSLDSATFFSTLPENQRKQILKARK